MAAERTGEGNAMRGYLIAQLEVTDPEPFEDYREKVPAVIARFGGRYLIRGGTIAPLEGHWDKPRMVVIEFDSVEAARTFYHSPEYQEILPLRLAAAEGAVAIVEGVPA